MSELCAERHAAAGQKNAVGPSKSAQSAALLQDHLFLHCGALSARLGHCLHFRYPLLLGEKSLPLMKAQVSVTLCQWTILPLMKAQVSLTLCQKTVVAVLGCRKMRNRKHLATV